MIVELDFKSSKFTAGLKSADAGLGKLETRVGRMGGIASRGFSTLGANLLKLGAVGAAAGVGLLALSVKEGQEAAKVQAIYAKALENSGKVSQEYVAILGAQQTALMNLGGVDDELIMAEQTKLIQMGLTGKQVAELTPLILDMSKATGKDLLTSTLAVGKAVNGSTTGLQRFGIIVDKAKAKVDPFGATMDALNDKFGGTTQALSGSLEVRLRAFQEGLANIRESIGIALLPALTKIVDVIGKSVLPAFQKFVDRILPGISKGIDDFAKALEGGGAEKAVMGISDALGTMVGLLQAAAGPVKLIVGAFMALPKELQTILVAGFAVNKLSGGMLTQLGGEIFKRGGTPANPLFVKDVGLPGGLGGGKGGPLGALPAVGGGAAAIGGATVAALAAGTAAAIVAGGVAAYGGFLALEGARTTEARNRPRDSRDNLRGFDEGERRTVAAVDSLKSETTAILSRVNTSITAGDSRTAGRIDSLNSAIRAIKIQPKITVPVYVTSTVSVRNTRIATAVSARYGGSSRIYEP